MNMPPPLHPLYNDRTISFLCTSSSTGLCVCRLSWTHCEARVDTAKQHDISMFINMLTSCCFAAPKSRLKTKTIHTCVILAALVTKYYCSLSHSIMKWKACLGCPSLETWTLIGRRSAPQNQTHEYSNDLKHCIRTRGLERTIHDECELHNSTLLSSDLPWAFAVPPSKSDDPPSRPARLENAAELRLRVSCIGCMRSDR
jgi:hypothetical protein